jgi:uncharacterized membrane protein YeiH
MQLSLRVGVPLPGVLLMGIINGFGGGLLRDVIVGDTPTMLQPGQYSVTAMIFSALLFLLLIEGLGMSREWAAWIVIVLYFTVRMLSIRYNWRTQPILPDLPP